MSTRFYFRPGSTPVAVTPDATWDFGSGGRVLGALVPEPVGASTAPSITVTQTATMGAGTDMVMGQFVSGPLPAQTLSGNFAVVVLAGEGNAADDAFLQIVVRVVSNDGTTVRGTAYAGSGLTTVATSPWLPNFELGLTSAGLKTRYFPLVTMAGVTVQANDRLVVEVGLRATPASGSRTLSMSGFTDREDALDYEAWANGPVTTPIPRRGWIEFSGDLFSALTRETYRFMYDGVLLNGDPPVPFVDITKVDGLDNAPLSLAQNVREGMHGGWVSSAFQTPRTVTLEGTIYANPTALEAYLDTLKANFRPNKRPHPLFIGTDATARMVYGKSQGLRYAKDPERRVGRVPFQVQIVCPDPRMYLAYSPKVSAVAFNSNVGFTVAGNRETLPQVIIRGGITNPNVTIFTPMGQSTFLYTGVVASDEVLIVDSNLRTAIKNYTINVRDDCTIADWPVLHPGSCNVTTVGTSLVGQPEVRVRYQEAFE